MVIFSVLILLTVSSFAAASFEFDILPLSLIPSDDKDSRFAHESSGEVVSVEEKTDYLKGGILKTSKVEETKKLNVKNGTITTKRKVTEFYRYPNGTIRKVEHGDDEFSGDTQIDCIEDHDCNNTMYCDRLNFACKPKLDVGAKCEDNKKCKQGLKCRNHVCTKSLGIEGEPCVSDQDCEDNHCCAFRFGDNVCSRKPGRYESCDEEDLFFSPKFFGLSRGLTTSEKPSVCPCQKGLKCEKKRTLFFLEAKTCQEPKRRNKTSKSRHHRTKDEKKDFKRSIVDDMMGLVAGLLQSITADKEKPFNDDSQ